jgi:hypothetical protein
MKTKKMITGIIVILVLMLLGTCDAIIPVEEEPEYTDVEYSTDASGRINQVTLYIDGVGVPVTKSMRAINRELAMMAFDYFEVVFLGGAAPGVVARTEWELGQPAGIGNVQRGVDYAFQALTGAPAPTATVGYASMFVGKKDGKTLLGLGYLSSTDTGGTTITTTTRTVTFYVGAITTGLTVNGETTVPITTGYGAGVQAASFAFLTGGGTNLGNGTTPVNYTGFNADNSVRAEVATGIRYPMYSFPENTTAAGTDQRQFATYTFSHINQTTAVSPATAATNMWGYVRIINQATTTTTFTADAPAVFKRVPRFMQGGRYREPLARWSTTNQINFRNAVTGDNFTANTSALILALYAPDSILNPVIPLIFTLKPAQSGIFSFFIQIPVYNLTTTANSATINPGGTPVGKWYVRTGVGSELYSLDDGVANGGCVFIQVGASAANWINIEWTWL